MHGWRWGVGALHVVDDNFLQPEPGVSARDHLWGGLVQVALLVAFAWGYPRLRPGLRGILAVYVGIFMIVMGAGEAGYYSREDGPSGDDYTGLLMIPAGVLLVGIGVVTLWRSRKGGSLVRRYARRAGSGARVPRDASFRDVPVLRGVRGHPLGARSTCRPRSSARPHENVSFTTSDGLRLKGWFVPSKNGATVISFPGRKGPQKPARLLVSEGYGVLLFDRRGEGESDGDPNALGWRGTRDLDAAIAYLRSRPDVDPDRIGGVGLSVGGEMMLQAAAENDDFRAIVSEGAGVRSVRESVHTEGAEKIVSSWIFGLVTAGTAVFTSDLPPPQPHRPQCRDHRAGALHPRDTRPGRRDADREVLRGSERSEGVLARAGRTHRRVRRRAAGLRAANRRLLRPAPARPFFLTPAAT